MRPILSSLSFYWWRGINVNNCFCSPNKLIANEAVINIIMVTWRLCNHSRFPKGNRWPLTVSHSYRMAPTFQSSRRLFLHAHLWNHTQWELCIYLQMVSGVFAWQFPMHTFTSQIMWQGSGPWLICKPKRPKKNHESCRGEFKAICLFFLSRNLCQRGQVINATWGGVTSVPPIGEHLGTWFPSRELHRKLHPKRHRSAWKELQGSSHALGSVFWEPGQLSANGNMSKRKHMTKKESSNFPPIWGAGWAFFSSPFLKTTVFCVPTSLLDSPAPFSVFWHEN